MDRIYIEVNLQIYIYHCELKIGWYGKGGDEILLKRIDEIIKYNEKKYADIVRGDEKLISRYFCKPYCEKCDPVICQFTLYSDMSDEAISEAIEKRFIRFIEIKKL